METTPANEVRTGLEILYAKAGSMDNVATRDLTKEARERYWIHQAADLGIAAKRTWASFGVTLPRMIERAELGRNRNEPGDGFVMHSGVAPRGPEDGLSGSR